MDATATMDFEIITRLQIILQQNQTIHQVLQKLYTMRANRQPNSDCINYIFHLMTLNNLFPDASKLEEGKSDIKSEEFRKLGNSYFSSKPPKYLKALAMYNKSMSYAESWENMSIAMTNRSAVLFKLQMYQECLKNIHLAQEFDIPESIQEKLERREAMCHEILVNVPPREVFKPEIGIPVNEKIPFLAKCLTLRETDKFGRHIITNEDIPAGTFIALEEPYCKTVDNSDKYFRCATCLLEVPHLLIPCDNCTQTMFCSKECKEAALKDFHAIECPISGSRFKIFDCRFLLAFRMCVKAFMAFPDTVTMALELERMDKEQENVFSFDWSKDLSPEQLYSSIYTSATNEDKLKIIYLPTYILVCLMFNLLKESSPIFSQRYMTTVADENIIKNVIMRNLLISSLNGMQYQKPIDISDLPAVYGSAMGRFYNLINHSCSPNISTVIIGSVLAVFSIKNIAAGEQIFMDYGYHHKYKEKYVRQQEIYEGNAFHCECLACLQDFPVFQDLPISVDLPPFVLYPQQACSCRFLISTNKKIFQTTRDYIRKYGHLYPTQQLCVAEEELIISLSLLYDGVSLRFREIPKCPKCNDRL